MDRINVTMPTLPPFEEFLNEIKPLWDSKMLTNFGVKHNQLEQKLQEYLDVENISLFTNGHLALEAAIECLELEGEIITTPFTFASTTHAIVRKGLIPVFCDINPIDFTIDVSLIESLINEKTCAILPVHVYGNICDIIEIEKLAKKYNLKVIYDAAHAFNVKYNDIDIGNFGDFSMFSFHSTKVFNTIEGGALTFKNENLKRKLKALKNFGITNQDSIEYIGGNSKMNEFQAVMGLCNLRHLDEEIEKRKKLVDRYRNQLQGIKGIKISPERDYITQNYSYFPILFDGYKNSRNEIMIKLEKENIFARKYFYPLTSDLICYQDKVSFGKTPIASYIAERVLTLPLYPDLSLSDIDRICNIIKS